MIIESKQLAGHCACGMNHTPTTERIIIEEGALGRLDGLIAQAGLTGPCAAVYDEATYRAVRARKPNVDKEIVLPTQRLVADEATVTEVLRQLDGETRLLIAIGAGTIHSLARYCASRLSIPFIACPTVASTDSFAGSSSTMRWHGEKSVLPGVAPTLLVADLDIIAAAPFALTRAGVCDALSNYTALADWRIACLMGDSPVCPAAEAMMLQSAACAQGAIPGLLAGDRSAYAQLMYALALPGIAIQLAHTPHPASGAEHMLAYLLQMQPELERLAPAATRGELAGISTAIIAGQYHALAAQEDIAPMIRRYERANARPLIENWREIRRILDDIPDVDTLTGVLAAIGARGFDALGIPESRLPELLRVAPGLREQMTLARLTRMCCYDSSALASRASSRRSRYADSAITRAGSSSAVSASSI